MKSFGESVLGLRKEKKLTLKSVADSLNIDLAILSKIERGHRKASRELVLKIGEYYQVDKNELMITWLSDHLALKIQQEENAMEVLQLAEDKVLYARRKANTQEQILNKIIEFFRLDGRVSKVWIFGSFARGEVFANHDIDLMVRYSDKASGTLFDYADIKFKLENLIKQKIDIVEEGFVQPFADESIDREKILIYGQHLSLKC
mgnify:CR=1 FL=1